MKSERDLAIELQSHPAQGLGTGSASQANHN